MTESHYDYTKFEGKVKFFGWLDHHAPPLTLLYEIVLDMDQFLSENENNVAAVHCKAGKGRTGTVICAYLLYKNMIRDPNVAVQFFAKKRLQQGKGVQTASQHRSIIYIDKIFKNTIPLSKIYSPRIVSLKRIIIYPSLCQTMKFGFEVQENAQRVEKPPIFSSPLYDSSYKNGFICTECHGVLLSGDVLFVAYSWGVLGKSMLFKIWFHTSFIENDGFCIDFGINDFDDSKNKVIRSNSLPRDTRVRFLFDDPKEM